MRFEPNKGWLHFCIFPRVKPDTDDAGNTPVYLNVYDLTPVNGYISWAGFGIFHSGVEVHGAEYAFGAHDYPSSGVFEVEPRQCPGYKFRKSILIGTTCLDALEVREFMEHHSAYYYGNTYNLIAKNCNHFCKDVCYRLTRKPIPKWVNRLAEIGTLVGMWLKVIFVGITDTNFNTLFVDPLDVNQCQIKIYKKQYRNRSSIHCVLPESFNKRNPSCDEECFSDKRKLQSSFSFLSPISIRQMQSTLKGCSPLREKRKSKNGLLNER